MTELKVTSDLAFISLCMGLPKQSRGLRDEIACGSIARDRVRASAKLFSSKAFKAIKSYDAQTRSLLLDKAIRVPSMFDGCYPLPGGMTTDAENLLSVRMVGRESLVVDFLTNYYESERDKARLSLGSAYHESDFPAPYILMRKFTMRWSIFTIRVPEGLPEDIKAQEIAKYQANMETVYTECRAALRETLSDLVGHLSERLKPDETGKRKRLYSSTVESLREFLDTVGKRDITSDAEIRSISEKARAILGEYSVEDLKGPIAGPKVREALDAVKDDIDSLIQREGGRKLGFDD